MLLTHSDSRFPGAEWLTSPKPRMPTIRLLLLITGNLRIFNSSMCRTALARSSSSRQQWMPGVMTSRAVARRAIEAVLRQASADDVAVGHHADQPVVLSNRNGAYVMLTHRISRVQQQGYLD